jgi:hypothetical protein
VWFEDTAARALEGRRGVAGLPESLLPISREMRFVESALRRKSSASIEARCESLAVKTLRS